MKKVLFVDQEKCSGCRMCEVVCSWFHDEEFNPTLSRIKVISYKEKSIDATIVCEQCEKAPCETACISKAISYKTETGAYVVDENKCIGCKTCIISCPLGAMSFNPIKRVSIKCDLCDGEPKCVKFCPMEAIQFIEVEKISIKKKIKSAEKVLRGTI